MKRYLIAFVVLCVAFFLPVQASYAITDPLATPNNKIGVHILFPYELSEAAALVNANHGDWGYVTIPIQAGEKDRVKWQNFMDQAKALHIIPIIRLATQGDYFNTQVWSKPTDDDIVDFANFLNSLDWPIKNRYIIVFNEVNRNDEWGGDANASEYANILSFTATTFKSKNDDFFILSAGLDNAMPTGDQGINEYNFMTQMNNAVPGIFSQVDGLSSHSYPNPGFASPPWIKTSESIDSFHYEQSLAQSLSGKKLPIFITETGWDDDITSADIIASYYDTALASVWNDTSIVAITPFLLRAGAGPFTPFSLIKTDGSQSAVYKKLASSAKVKGQPVLPPASLNLFTAQAHAAEKLPIADFLSPTPQPKQTFPPLSVVKTLFKWLLHV